LVAITDNANLSAIKVVEVDNNPNDIKPISLNQGEILKSFPNPFANETTISYYVNNASHIKLDVYNIMGQRVAALVNEYKYPGEHKVIWSANQNSKINIVPGFYTAKLEAKNYKVLSNKILICKI